MWKWLQRVTARRTKCQVIAVALVCFVCLAATAQAAHFHRGTPAQYSNHHCSLCSGVHVAPVLPAAPVVTPPARTLAAVEVAELIDCDKLLSYSLYVRPPPAS
jgi:hypothetical protein